MSESTNGTDDQGRDPASAEVLGSAEPETGIERDPEDWVTGDEPITGPQRSYLDSLARQAGEEIPADITKAEASEHIERLRKHLGIEDAAPDASS